ncbi:hypothetical protein ATN01_01490 [Buchnera aphidicola (Diuraphis noxia)]|uniref:Flavodoxin n=1 Tax=Buchnera aphidicola subsp. Diuraphis noxia TaxID=118101 RepID=A0A1B2H8K5_BUCDN|nr:flavodoxin FldA [Buchnera aphidicola]ANZ22512.1 hypothetical protein ATN01_01490 [Buchnera aphidicola (Diuraphis noxia)]
MKKIGLFFGSDTGNTENIAKLIQKSIGKNICILYDISNSTQKDLEKFDSLILGIPTWYYGEIQCDWDDFLPTLKKINFSGKTVALFGCGDQEDYSEFFCDAIGLIYKVIKEKNAKIIGEWPTKGYFFEKSKALLNREHFVGLVLDEDRQPDKTNERIKKWLKSILASF